MYCKMVSETWSYFQGLNICQLKKVTTKISDIYIRIVLLPKYNYEVGTGFEIPEIT
jgi:hypothetical protein